MKEGQKLWTREELIVVLNLYLKLPFGKLDQNTPEVQHLARIIGRTKGAVSMRLNNFAGVDPFHKARGIKGLAGGIKQVQPIWKEFIDNKEELIFESEKILASKENIPLEKKYSESLRGTEHLKGAYKIRETKIRVNQDVFREIVLSNYDGRCAITGIDIAPLLRASHIIPWSKNEKERLNPENGICFSALYDCAYDKGYISVDKKFKIVLSKELKKNSKKEYYLTHFAGLENIKLNMPKKYSPKKEFLDYHLDTIFKR